jgi:hypothetical protein
VGEIAGPLGGDATCALPPPRHLLARTAAAERASPQVRAAAHAELGAALVRLDSAAAALPHLDSAALSASGDRASRAIARVWRAQALSNQGDGAAAWSDLLAAASYEPVAPAAVALMLQLALQSTDLERFGLGLAYAAGIGDGRVVAALLAQHAPAAARTWGHAAVAGAAAALPSRQWGEGADRSVERTLAMLSARALLREARTLEELERLHSVLGPAAGDADAAALQSAARAVRRLAEQAADGLPLFAAAEIARDELDAPGLAQTLFLSFADVAADTPWAGKAVLAAHAISAGAATDARLAALHDNVYVRAASGQPVDAELTLAEERLARGLAGLRDAAMRDSHLRDAVPRDSGRRDAARRDAALHAAALRPRP